MWISKAVAAMFADSTKELRASEAKCAVMVGECVRLKTENERLRADMDWFKLRLNQVERERGQLIQAAIGVKIAVPEFVPTFEDPAEALNQMPDMSTVGGDAAEVGEPTEADRAEGVDYSLMPGYKGNR